MSAWYERVRADVARLPAQRPGSLNPGFLEPPYAHGIVEAFERRCAVRLPREYRDFILHAGACGAGPGCGLMSLERDRAWDDALPDESEWLDKPFTMNGSRVSWPVHEGDDEAYDIATDARMNPRWWQGTFALAHYGCATRAYLVVTGDLRGHVILDHPFHETAYFDADVAARLHGERPRRSLGEPMTFEQWYLDWLDCNAFVGARA